jgi:hypothetical protein
MMIYLPVMLLLSCRNMGYIIPYYDEDKNGTATGYCYGIPPSAKTLASALIKDKVSQACRPANIRTSHPISCYALGVQIIASFQLGRHSADTRLTLS